MNNPDNLINYQGYTHINSMTTSKNREVLAINDTEDYNHITTTMTSKDRVSTPIDADEIIGIKILQVN